VKPSGTVTLALPKTGLTNENSGRLFLVDLGIPNETYNKIGFSYHDPFGENFFATLKIIEDD